MPSFSTPPLALVTGANKGIGQEIALAPPDGDPKDLFRLTTQPAG